MSADRRAPVVLSFALIGISFAAPIIRLSEAAPLAISTWRLAFALVIIGAILAFTITPAPPPLPVLTTIDPESAEVSQFVNSFSVAGQNLGGSPQVSFNPAQGITIIGRRASGALVLQIANDAAPGQRLVTASATGGVSNGIPFTILAKTGNFNISNLRSTAPSGSNGSFSLTVDFTDPSGAASSGVNYVVNLQDVGVTLISAVPQGVVSGRTSGSIRLDLSVSRSLSRLGLVQVNLVNSSGNRSNTLEGTF